MLVASVRLVIFILENCLHFEGGCLSRLKYGIAEFIKKNKGRRITVTVNSKLYGNMRLEYRIR